MLIKEFYLENLTASRELASKVSPLLKTGDILTFEGTLGAGKTEFCRALIHALGYNEDVPSPTFNLVQIYEPALDDLATPAVWHMDLYRLEKAEDIFELGIEDGFETAVSMIEWPNKMGRYLPAEHLKIKLSMGKIEGSRNISFNGDEHWAMRLKDLSI